MYNYPKLASIAGVTDAPMAEGGFDGTAETFLPRSPLAKYLYAVKFSRDCAAQRGKVHCVDIAHGARQLEANSSVVFIERMYLNPISKSGPSACFSLAERAS